MSTTTTFNPQQRTEARIAKAQGCLMGQIIGDSLGALVEFQHPQDIAKSYPNGVTELRNGGTWNLLAGQPTDDSELALAIARSIIKEGSYTSSNAFEAYLHWYHSGPFDCGGTISAAMNGKPNYQSQANGALMRLAPIAIYGARSVSTYYAERLAKTDARLTHPNPVCGLANAAFAAAVHAAIYKLENDPLVLTSAAKLAVANKPMFSEVRSVLDSASKGVPPATYTHQMGWVLIALQNAFYQLVNAPSFEAALRDTIAHGGDTDTNAAIAGALYGACHGIQCIPERYIKVIENCRPSSTLSLHPVQHPRPQEYWPCDAMDLARALIVGHKA